MDTKLKITETTNDKLKEGNGLDATVAIPRIEAAHEPLASDAPFVFKPGAAIPFPVGQFVPGGILQGAPPQPAAAPVKVPLKIAILGTAPSSRMLAPFNDPSWKIWACSAGNMNALPRVDAWFEVHANLLWPENAHFGAPYLNWLNSQQFPVYMQNQTLVPRAISFPKDELVAEFGRYFFTSSFAWMIAFAIKSGADEIGLWGVDMASKDEYILQRSGGHYFIQEAKKRGIKVFLPQESDLLQPPPLYGFDDSTAFLRKVMVRKKELTDRLNAMRPQRDQMNNSIVYLEGALEDVDYIISIWGGAQTAQTQ